MDRGESRDKFEFNDEQRQAYIGQSKINKLFSNFHLQQINKQKEQQQIHSTKFTPTGVYYKNQLEFEGKKKQINWGSQNKQNKNINGFHSNSYVNRFPSLKSIESEISFNDMREFSIMDYSTLKYKLKQIHSLKNCLPEIKKLDGYQYLFKLGKNLISLSKSEDDSELIQYLFSIIQSKLFKNSVNTIQNLLQVSSFTPISQAFELITDIVEVLIFVKDKYSNPQEFESQFITFTFILMNYRQINQDDVSFNSEEQEIKIFIKEVKEQKQQQLSVNNKIASQQITELYLIDTDISNTSIIPTKEEIITNDKYLQHFAKVPFKGSYLSSTIYLVNNYFLLRQDFFRDINEELHRLYESGRVDLAKLDKKFLSMFYVYCNSLITNIQFDKNGIYFNVTTYPLFIKGKKKFQWLDQNSSRLMNGSLLILTNLDFDQIYYLVVRSKDKSIDYAYQNEGKVIFTAELQMDNIDGKELRSLIKNLQLFCANTNVIIFETKYYWEAYSHYLRGINKIIQDAVILPFQETLIKCEKQVKYPDFIDYNTTYAMKIDIVDQNKARDLILIRDNWDSVYKGTLDESQFNCLRNILTKQVSIIQGPPGTGKTFVGSLAVKVLSDNYYKWNKTNAPILLICKTNHALDQFLKHIEKYENKIVRIGSRSQDPSLNKYMIRNIMEEYQRKQIIHYNPPSLRKLKQTIEKINDCYKCISQDIEDLDIKDSVLQEYDEFNFDIQKEILNGFFNFFELSTGPYNKSYINELVIQQWWKNEISLDYFQNILSGYKLSQFEKKVKEWNQQMRYQRQMVEKELIKQIEDKFFDVNKLDDEFIKKQHMNRMNNNKDDQSDDDDENDENFVQNKVNYNVQDYYEFFQSEANNNQFRLQTCDTKQLIETVTKIKNGFNIFKLDYKSASNIKAYLGEMQKKMKLKQIKHLLTEYKSLLNDYKEERNKEEANILTQQGYRIIGMTLNGAAIHYPLLKYLKSPIVIIEEAGEVLENLIIPVLQPSTKQLILIGDHKQLRPQINNYHLSKEYNLNTSMLERLVNNKIEFAQLKEQRRMRPEFADFIRLIYENYSDNQSLKTLPDIKGMPRNMYLLTHSELEESVQNSTSKKNRYEAEYAIKLAQFILLQGQFKQEQITILSMYLGQAQLIRKISREKRLEKIKISSVDNYQGEENEIIILSLVRSNNNGELGHTNTENRINVAFSRAKLGFYCIGNFNMIKRVSTAKLWRQIIDLATQKNLLVEQIEFYCTQHNIGTIVKHYQDFDQMPRGGCIKYCQSRKICGHICNQSCHPSQCEQFKCYEKCQLALHCGHNCNLPCYEECICTTMVLKQLPCGHNQMCLCRKDVQFEECQTDIEMTLICGHQKSIKCFQKYLSLQCETMIDHTYECGHLKRIRCYQKQSAYKCTLKVEFTCPDCCISTLIKECHDSPTNQTCTIMVNKILVCGHQKMVPCKQSVNQVKDCQEVVIKRLTCGHNKQMLCCESIHDVKDCQEKLKYFCLHCSTVQSKQCYQKEEDVVCMNVVNKILPCGHSVSVECYQDLNYIECDQLVSIELQCGHCIENELCKVVNDDYAYQCKQLCGHILECGHPCNLECYQDCNSAQCNSLNTITLDCNHQKSLTCYQIKQAGDHYLCQQIVRTEKRSCCQQHVQVLCHESLKKDRKFPECISCMSIITCPHNKQGQTKEGGLCSQPCNQMLECGHKCQASCQECVFGLIHHPCQVQVKKKLICGHHIQQECYKDVDFCQQPCDVKQCEHSSRQQMCNNKCLSKCSIDIAQQICKQCSNFYWNHLECKHSIQHLDQYFYEKVLDNPFEIPKCDKCEQSILLAKYKVQIKDIKINLLLFQKTLIRYISQHSQITQEDLQQLVQQYPVFNNQPSLINKCRYHFLWQGVKQFNQLIYLIADTDVDAYDKEEQLILRTIKQQTRMIEIIYLKKEWINLSFENVRLLFNSIVYLTALFRNIVHNKHANHQLIEIITFPLPISDQFDLLIYKLFKHNQEEEKLTFLKPDQCYSLINHPVVFQLCPKGHATKEKIKCQYCKLRTSPKEFQYIQS